jgi:hypothetical protein
MSGERLKKEDTRQKTADGRQKKDRDNGKNRHYTGFNDEIIDFESIFAGFIISSSQI